jgi:REP element-mobilizing transposase RayT
MSRPWRIEYEGALYHLLSRGNEGSDIFIDEKDRNRFLEAVGEMSQRFDIDIFAYVLMDNHYHLLVRTRRANLKKAMQWFGTTYTQRFNRRHFRSGHLFQGRYKSIIIQNEHIGNLFGLSYSRVSHAVKSAKLILSKNQQLQTKFGQLNSLFKV